MITIKKYQEKEMEKKGFFFGFLAIFLWSLNYFVVQQGVFDSNPIFFTFVRLAIAIPFMVLFRPKQSVIIMLIITLFWNVGSFNLVALALKNNIIPSSAAILQQSNAGLLMLLSIIFYRQNISIKEILFLSLSFLGIIIFFLPNIFLLEMDYAGLLIIFSCLSWAIGMILIKKYKIDSSLGTVIWMAGLGSFIQFPIVFFLLPMEEITVTYNILLWGASSFLISSIFANYLWFKSSIILPNNSLSQLVLLIPVIVMIIDVLYFRRIPDIYEITGGCVIISAILVKMITFQNSKK